MPDPGEEFNFFFLLRMFFYINAFVNMGEKRKNKQLGKGRIPSTLHIPVTIHP